jgi:hypothetical protein
MLNDCPFLVHLYFSFQSAGKLYFVMDFVGGGDLSVYFDRVGRFSEAVTRHFGAQLRWRSSFCTATTSCTATSSPKTFDRRGRQCRAHRLWPLQVCRRPLGRPREHSVRHGVLSRARGAQHRGRERAPKNARRLDRVQEGRASADAAAPPPPPTASRPPTTIAAICGRSAW